MEILASGRLGFTLNWLTFGTLVGIPLTCFVGLVSSVAASRVRQRTPVRHWFVP